MGVAGAKGITCPSAKHQRFLELYDIGDCLGEGGFGVVYRCTQKGIPTPQYAVKMVDKVESAPDEIKKESELIINFSHQHIIKCHDVINEECFVCLVMDLFTGGDLVSCMNTYWHKGKIPYPVSLGLTFQMCSALEYLHANLVIHRDVKADNLLCDREDIGDPAIRLVLTDFGTAKKLRIVKERLNERTGTKMYWSPEFYRMSYSVPVDIWAVGVVLYGLIQGSFPFKNVEEVNCKVLRWPEDLPSDVREFALTLLERLDVKRITAAQACMHPLLAAAKENEKRLAPLALQPNEKANEDSLEEMRANKCIKIRRAELVARMQPGTKKSTRHDVVDPPPGKRAHYFDDAFAILDKREGNINQYEWWDGCRAASVMDHFHHIAVCHVPASTLRLSQRGPCENGRAHAATVDMVTKMLKEHDIDVELFGKGTARSLDQLATEVQKGTCILKLDAANYKRLVRVVDFVGVRVCRVSNGVKEYVIEVKQNYADGCDRSTNRLPGTKKEAHENTLQTAARIVKSEMGLEGKVHLDVSTLMAFEKEEMSPSYPGVLTVYQSELIEGTLIDAGEKMSTTFSHAAASGESKVFSWMSEHECKREGIQYQALPKGQTLTSALVHAPLGFHPERLQQYLQEHKIESANFGKGEAATLLDFSDEVMNGESSFRLDGNGHLIRVVDVVLLKLTRRETGNVLVQAHAKYSDGSNKNIERLPGTKRRPDENQFMTAKRVIVDHLLIDENLVTIDPDCVEEVEDEQQSVTYPGLTTVYHKRIISAVLEDSGPSHHDPKLRWWCACMTPRDSY